MKEVFISALLLVYNAGLIVGTVYLIQFYDWSMWTFLLTALFFMSSSKSK